MTALLAYTPCEDFLLTRFIDEQDAREADRATDHEAPCIGALSNSTVSLRSFPSAGDS